jgi:hypothetical protein
MEQKWYNSLESLLNANEGEDGKYYKLSGLDDKAARVASYTIGFEGLLNKTSLVVFCLFVCCRFWASQWQGFHRMPRPGTSLPLGNVLALHPRLSVG